MKSHQYPVWTVRDAHELQLLSQFAKDTGISSITAQVLWRRGIKTKGAYEELIAGSKTLSSPFDLPDMEQAVAALTEAKGRQERIRVYGDYDADGVTATAVMVKGLTAWGVGHLVDYYIPNRFDEGYGLNVEAVQQAAVDGVSWLITVDCGSSSPEAAEVARQLGVRLLITDHHGLPDRLPQARALVNPERMLRPNRLSGAGVALQVIRALLGDDTPQWCYGVAAIGTVADVVPLRGDNRLLVRLGLDVLQQGQVLGVNALMAVRDRTTTHINADDLGYSIGPQLNAAGRMGDADLAVQVLLSMDEPSAMTAALSLNSINQQRRELERDITQQAWEWLSQHWESELPAFVVVAGDGWHHGVIGIVASRLKEALRRPVAVIGWDKEEGKGSGRGIEGLHLLKHMRQHADQFTKLGGHQGAAGFSLLKQDPMILSHLLSQQIPLDVRRQSRRGPLVDWQGMASQIDQNVLREFAVLEPFGHGFERPRFLLSGEIGDVWTMGAQHQHLAMTFKHSTMRTLLFQQGPLAEPLSDASFTRVVAKLEWNTFRGRTNPQWLAEEILEPRPTADIKGRVVWQRAPSDLNGRVIWIVSGRRAAWPSPFVGVNYVMQEAAQRGHLTNLAIDAWRPWPRLENWADHVVWLIHPPSRWWLQASARLLNAEGTLWVDPDAPKEPVARFMEKLTPNRDKMARHWRNWKRGGSPLVIGRSIFRELGLDPNDPATTKSDLQNSVLYQDAVRRWQEHEYCWQYPLTLWEDLPDRAP